MSERAFQSLWVRTLEGLEALYYPPYCALCDRPLTPPPPSPFICRDCLGRLPFRMDREALAWEGPCPLYASFYYRDDLPKLIVSLKFSDRADRALLLGPLMARTLERRKIPADALIPLPLHPRREKERGYNQVRLLARSMSEATGIPSLEGLLFRPLYTDRQSEQGTVKERRAQMKGAFAVKADHPALPFLAGRPVILLDDVLTTGASLAEAASCLIRAGLKVTGLVAASNKDPYQAYGQVLNRWYG